MTAYNFSEQFAPAVEAGLKLQTIRKTDKDAMVGGIAQLYTGQRTKQCKLLGTGTITSISRIVLFDDSCQIEGILFMFSEVPNIIARADGFATYEHMAEWFRNTYKISSLDETPFDGFIHAWVLNTEVQNGRN